MKKIEVNFDDITQNVIDVLARKYPKGFLDSDIISFSHLTNELEDRVKLTIGDTVYLVKKSTIEDWDAARYESGYFNKLNTDDPSTDADA